MAPTLQAPKTLALEDKKDIQVRSTIDTTDELSGLMAIAKKVPVPK